MTERTVLATCRIMVGMWEIRTTGDLATRALAVARELPGVVVCRATAAWLWGLDVLPPGVRDETWDVDVLTPPGLPLPRLPRIRTHPGRPRDEDVTAACGILLTDPVRTAVDCAYAMPRYAALAALDTFLRAGVPPADLRRRLNAGGAVPGRAQAAELLPLADPRADSPGESWARLLIIDAGLPTPAPQVPVPCFDGHYYLDLGIPAYRTAIEYDGHAHHDTSAALRRDRGRRALIRASGWEVVVIRHHDVRAWPHLFLRSVYEVLLAQGWRPPDARRVEIETRIRKIAAQARLDQGLR